MDAKWFETLRNGSHSQKLRAWHNLTSQPEFSSGTIRPDDRRRLARILQQEENPGVVLCALTHLCELADRDDGEAKMSGRERPTTLDELFSSYFHHPSVVLGVRDITTARRDELAMVELGRRLPERHFPLTSFDVVPLQDPSWRSIVEEGKHVTLLTLGRLALFGKEATQAMGGSKLRFSFPDIDRPADVPNGVLHPQYHQIIERDPANGTIRSYTAHDQGDLRTDYALVQIYPVSYGLKNLTYVVVCAGCASLGTMGAARWLASDLGRAYDQFGGEKISLPTHVKSESRLEVLLRVTADLRVDNYRPTSIQICKMFLDDWQWSPETNLWQPTATNIALLRRRNGRTEQAELNGVPISVRPTSQNRRIIFSMLEHMAEGQTNRVPLSQLANNKQIWDGAAATMTKVKQRVHNLKNTLFQGTLEIHGDDVYFNGTVRFADAPEQR